MEFDRRKVLSLLASTSTMAPLAAQAAGGETLRLFGLDFAVAPSGELLAPVSAQIDTRWQWHSRIDRTHKTLRFDGALLFAPHLGQPARWIYASLSSLKLAGSAATGWVIENGTYPSGGDGLLVLPQSIDNHPANAFLIAVGPLTFGGTSATIRVIQHEPHFTLTATNVPTGMLPIDVGMPDPGMRLDLSTGDAVFPVGSLQATTSSRFYSGIDGPSYRIVHKLALETRQPVADNSPEVTFVFAPAKGAKFPLHVDLLQRGPRWGKDNPLVAGLFAEDYLLNATWRVAPGVPQYKSIFLSAAGANLTVRSAALATDANLPARWLTPKIELAMRPAHDDLPSTFLVKDQQTAIPLQLHTADADSDLHGGIRGAVVTDLVSATLSCSLRDGAPTAAGVAPDLLATWTLPSFVRPSGPDLQLISGRPGDSFADIATNAIRRWEFTGQEIGLPALPREHLMGHGIGDAVLQAHEQALNAGAAKLDYRLQDARHETSLIETTSAGSAPSIKPQSIFNFSQPTADGADTVIRPTAHALDLTYGPITITARFDPAQTPDYIAIWRGDEQFIRFNGVQLDLEPGYDIFKTGLSFGAKPAGQGDRPLAIVKLSSRLTIEQIFQRIDAEHGKVDWGVANNPDDATDKRDMRSAIFDPAMLVAGWTGLVLFDLQLDFQAFDILQSLLAPGALSLAYLSLSPRRKAATADDAFSRSGYFFWRNTNSAAKPAYDPSAGTRTQEVSFQTKWAEGRWANNTMTLFRLTATAGVGSLFAQKLDGPPASGLLRIDGTFDPARHTIQFVGQFKDPVKIFERAANGPGPINLVTVSSAAIAVVNGETELSIDGEVTLGDVDFDTGAGGGSWLKTWPSNKILRFAGLSFSIPHLPSGADGLAWRPFAFRYPSLAFDFDGPHFQFLGISGIDLKITGIGVDWDNAFNWGRFIPLKNDGGTTPRFLLGVRLDFSDLPELAFGDLKRLQFDLQLGIAIGGDIKWDFASLRAGISGVAFEPFNLALLRFLQVHADKVDLKSVSIPWGHGNTSTVPWISAQNVSIRILDFEIVDGLYLSLFTLPDGKRGFLAYIAPKTGFEFSLLTIHWVLIGQNIVLSKDLAERILTIDLANLGSNGTLGTEIFDSAQANTLLPGPDADGNVGEWTFAAGISVLGGTLDGKFLFQDKRYYGIALHSAWLSEWIGFDLAISVLYIKRERADEDGFYVSLSVPAVNIGTIRFMGGSIAVEIQMNGGFLLDIAFPWPRANGSRDWDRTLGAIVTPFQGSGGFYIAKRTWSVATGTGQNSRVLVLSGGFALQAGLGATFGGGIFTVWVRAGIFLIIEGQAAMLLNKDGVLPVKLYGLKLAGAVGIIVEGGGELNFWIISARVTVFASAEAGAQLTWGYDPSNPVLQDPSGPATLALHFVLYASASAEACVGCGPFKICKSISVSVCMPFQHTLQIG